MALLTPPPKINLSRLRDIGWSLWDPIGLLKPGQRWEADENQSFADEYDAYLIEAAGQVRRDLSEADVVNYLVTVEADHMGLGTQPGAYERARSVVAAIDSDETLWTYPEERR